MGQKLFSTVLLSAMTLATAFSAERIPAEVKYEAKSVSVNLSFLTGPNKYSQFDRNYELVGLAPDGHQIWASTLSVGETPTSDKDPGCDYAQWTIDGGEYVSNYVGSFYSNTIYDLDTSFKNHSLNHRRSLRTVSNGHYSLGHSFVHYIKPFSQTSAQFMAYKVGAAYEPEEFSINTHIDMTTSSEVYDIATMKHIINVDWNVANTYDAAIDKVTLYAQMAGIEEPTVFEITGKSSGSNTFEIPWYIKDVTITAKASTTSLCAGLIHEEIQCDTIQRDLLLDKLPCSIKVTDLRESFDDDLGTYNPAVEWTCPDGHEIVINNVSIDYSGDNGKTWQHNISANRGAGTGTLSNVLPGYSKYIFRYNGRAEAYNQSCDAINLLAYDTIEVNYNPQIIRLALIGDLTENCDEQNGTIKPTIAYTLNRDLYEMSAGKAVLDCSVDNGKFEPIATFFPEENGTQTIEIGSSGKVFHFRLRVPAISEGLWVSFEEETPAYYRFMGVDDITIDDNTPVDVYTIDGKLVAKQVLPSDAKTRLANGTYIVGGKKMVINK